MSLGFFAGTWYRLYDPTFFGPSHNSIFDFFLDIEWKAKRHSPIFVVLGYDMCIGCRDTSLGLPTGAAFLAEGISPPEVSLADEWGWPRYFFYGIGSAVGLKSYRQMFLQIKQALRQGYTYQVNLTFPLMMRYGGDLLAAFLDIAQAQQGRWHAFVSWEDWHILSFSPELFFELEHNTLIMRPMKGTWSKGKDVKLSDKDRAENVMIVDMARNDMGRVCAPSSIQTRLFIKEEYPTVIQLVSEITGTIRKGVGIADILDALFPCASITGAPKLKTIDLIDSIEPVRRGIYTGAIGIIGRDHATFNVAIRSLEARSGGAVFGIGGGIVWDSDCLSEFGEAFLKARFFVKKAFDFCIIETMRWEYGNCPLLQYHLERITNTARFFGFRFNDKRFAIIITRCANETRGGIYKVRLLLFPSGRISYALENINTKEGGFTACISEEVIDPSVVWHYHKTTRRQQYDRALASARAAGFDEAIMLNKSGFVSQGTFTNVFIKEKDGRFATPFVEEGCLNGVLRRSMMDSDIAYERRITSQELYGDNLYLGNSVRGLIKATVSR